MIKVPSHSSVHHAKKKRSQDAANAEKSVHRMSAHVDSKVPTRMAKVIVTMKIMPEGPETNLDDVESKVKEILSEFEAIVSAVEKEPVGFGLVALVVKFAVDEDKGGTEPIENKIAALESVTSAEVTMVSRALG